MTSKSERIDAICGSPETLKLNDELLHMAGVDVCVGALGNNAVVKMIEETGFHRGTPLISCVIRIPGFFVYGDVWITERV